MTQDIVATWRRPGRVVRRLLDDGMDDGTLIYLTLITCVLIFVAQTPFQSREAFLDPSIPLSSRLFWSGLFFVVVMPIILYLIAALSHVIAGFFGGKGRWIDARFALVWALLAVTPLTLLRGMVAGFIGVSPALQLTTFLWVVAFFAFWVRGLIVAETQKTFGAE
ncbi:YIP1 family protein [Aestuariibius sp. HNIBRBA575]|uniref:YIP1 family protein n=1 Tax=Aestuariibius sp. HNIBRBA575 TaxID=3233343 RepID=UPI0034A2E4FD